MKKNMNIKELLTKAAGALCFLACCYFCASLFLKGMGGAGPGLHVKSGARIAVALLLAYFCAGRKTYWLAVFPLSLLGALYAPAGLTYGYPDYQSFASLLATDPQEAGEFLSQIPAKSFLKGAAIPVLAWLAYFISTKLSIRPWRNKAFTLAAIAALVVTLHPTRFFEKACDAYRDNAHAASELEKYVSKSAWSGTSPVTEKKDYVLVIGESARRDYFHLYGYPLENTPFLDSAPATVVDGLESGAAWTIGSLRIMLTDPDRERWEPRFDRNLMDLANSAGIDTWWISVQGYVGTWDTPVSAIGSRANHPVFLNRREYDSTMHSDYELLPVFEKKLAKEASGARLFVLHTMGSHPDACARLEDFPAAFKSKNPEYRYVACYASTVKKTDDFLSKAYGILKRESEKSGRPFSMIYFADHGQIHRKIEGEIRINNNACSAHHLEVPLVRFDSDASSRKTVKAYKSGGLFTAGLAAWMGIRNPELPEADLFSEKDDPEFKARVPDGCVTDDRAIDISPFL